MAEQAERLAVVENEVKNVKDIALRLESKFDAALANFVTQQQLAALRVVFEREVANSTDKLSSEIASMRSTKWRDLVIQVILTAAIAGLIGYFVAGAGTPAK